MWRIVLGESEKGEKNFISGDVNFMQVHQPNYNIGCNRTRWSCCGPVATKFLIKWSSIQFVEADKKQSVAKFRISGDTLHGFRVCFSHVVSEEISAWPLKLILKDFFMPTSALY